MIDILVSILAASVVGSLHCTSMCGGLVAFSTAATTPRGRASAITAYNGTRGLGYVLLGTVAGALGSTLDHVGLRVGLGRVAGAVAGTVMIAWGLLRLAEAGGVVFSRRSPSVVDVPLAKVIRRLRDQPPVMRSAIVGGCTAALPCGFLHAFVVLAAGTGSAVQGALVMAAFWFGTLPAVVGLGVGTTLLWGPLRRHASVVGALLLVGFGLTSLLGRWSPSSFTTFVRGHASQALVGNSAPSNAR